MKAQGLCICKDRRGLRDHRVKSVCITSVREGLWGLHALLVRGRFLLNCIPILGRLEQPPHRLLHTQQEIKTTSHADARTESGTPNTHQGERGNLQGQGYRELADTVMSLKRMLWVLVKAYMTASATSDTEGASVGCFSYPHCAKMRSASAPKFILSSERIQPS